VRASIGEPIAKPAGMAGWLFHVQRRNYAMKTINSLISVIVLIVILVIPQRNVSAADLLTWENRQDMPTARYSMGAAVSNNKIYVIGGDNWSCTPLTNVEEYDPETNTWSIRASMPTGRWSLEVASGQDGKIYAIGGVGGPCGSDILDEVEVYDPSTDSWETRTSMPTLRVRFGMAAATNGKIYVFGGEDSTTWFATVEEYDPATDSWTRKSDMPYPNKSMAVTAASNGKIYLLGGDAIAEALLEYDPETDSWTSRATAPTSRYGVKISQGSDGRIYAIGGVSLSDEFLSTVESYDPLTDTWRSETGLQKPRSGHVVVTVDQFIYAIGGGWRDPDGNFGPINSVEAGTVTPRPAVIWYVTTTGDDNNECLSPATPCTTINGAINKAVGGDIIKVAVGTYTGNGSDVVLIKKDILLSGGWDLAFTIQNDRSTLDGQGERRGLQVLNSTAVVDRFIVQNGFSESQGGGIHNYSGELTLSNSIISGNVSKWMGGGIFNYGTLTINNTSIIGNSAGDWCCGGGGGGGGIQNYSGVITLNNSTVSGNVILGGFSGSGIAAFPGKVILNNSTVSNNTGGSGEGIYTFVGSIILNNSTISGNESYGARNQAGNVTLQNTILAGNGTDGDCYNDPSYSGTVISQGYNLIGKAENCTLTNTDLISVDPLLGAFLPEQGYYPLLPGSPAIDAGNPSGCIDQNGNLLVTDQRGVSRPQDGNGDGIATCDMGAYEFVSPVIYIKIDIKPGSNTNPINLGAKGVIPVAVLTTREFNAATLDSTTVLFAGASPLRWSKQDVDYDRDMDLLFHFDVRSLQLTKSSVEATLTGTTFDGRQVKGADKVKIVPVSYP
jgi:N-acetylneuraminic acid mutarotase